MKQLILIEENTLEGLTRENLVSPESMKPFDGLAIDYNYSKDYLASVAQNIIEAVDEGFADPLEIHVMGKALIQIGSALEKSTKESASMKATEQGRKGSFKGCEFQLRNGATYYDYSADPMYADLEAKLKARKEALNQALKTDLTIVDENGEEVQKVPVKGGGGETLNISFK
jgi:hypothetical protein